jgi:hypothetical protein
MAVRELLIRAEDRGKQIEICTHVKIGAMDATKDPGVLDVWRDGTLVGRLRQSPPWRMAEGEGKDYFRHGYLFGWANAGFGEPTVFWLDRIEFHATRPDDWPAD